MALFGRRREREPEDPASPAPLPVPPFTPDPPSVAPPASAVPEHPEAVLAAHGVSLPGALRRMPTSPDLPVWSVAVGVNYAATDLWTAVRDVHPRVGLWPVLATAETWDRTAAGMGEVPDPIGALDAAVWLTDQAEADLAEMPRGPTASLPDDGLDWDDLVVAHPEDFDQLLLVPASGGWEVPGLLGWTGAANIDVLGDIHTAVLRRWSAQWGAELVALGPDTMTLRAAAPPSTSADALALAVAMTLYCEDSVHQGVGTVDALVPMAAAKAWWFWWD